LEFDSQKPFDVQLAPARANPSDKAVRFHCYS